jgi:hypothetical protein
LDVFARATGIAFGNSSSIIVNYTIIEYTSSTFATAKSHEKGVTTLVLGASSGIANCTLKRSGGTYKPQVSATSLNSQPATQNILPGTGISIGTAANTLVFIGPSAVETLAFSPYFNTTGADANTGVFPLAVGADASVNVSDTMSDTQDFYSTFIWAVPMLVKRITCKVGVAYTGGTPVSNFYARIYQINSAGQPGKLIYDFGAFGANSLNSTGVIQSGAAGAGFFLTTGEYYMGFMATLSGGTTPPQMQGNWGHVQAGRTGMVNGTLGMNYIPQWKVTSGTGNTTAPDPANVTGWTSSGVNFPITFALSPT